MILDREKDLGGVVSDAIVSPSLRNYSTRRARGEADTLTSRRRTGAKKADDKEVDESGKGGGRGRGGARRGQRLPVHDE